MAGGTVTLGILVTASAGAAHGALQSLGQNMARLRERTAEATQVHARLGEKLALLGRQGRPVEGLSDAYVKLGRTIEQAQAQAERFAVTQERIAGHKAAAGELWGQAVGVAGLGLAMAAPVRTAMRFEQSMARVGAVARASDEELAQLADTARRLGASTNWTASQAAEGLQFLAMAGFSAEQSIAAMPGMLDLASAGAVDLGSAADIASNILTGFGMRADEMERLGDVLTNAFTSSNTSLGMLGESMKYVAPVAAATGVSLEQAAAMVGKLGDAGMQGSMAGTSLRAVLSRLTAPSGAAAKALEGLGVSTTDAVGNLRSVPDILAEMDRAMSGMGTAARAELTSTIFGLEAASAATVLLGEAGRGSLQAYALALGETGSATRVAAQQNATAEGALKRLGSAVESIGITLGGHFLQPLAATAERVAGLVAALDAWARENPAVVSTIGKLAGALLVFKAGSLAARAAFHLVSVGVLGGIGRVQALRAAWISASLAMQTRSLAPLLGGAAPAAAGLLGRLREIANSGAPMRAVGWQLGQIGAQAKVAALAVGGALKGALLGAGQAVLWLGRAVMLNPVGLTLTAAAVLVYKFWGPIAGFFRGLWSGVRAGLAPVGAAFESAFAPVMPVLRPIGEWLSRVAGWFGGLLRPMEDAGGAAEALGVRVGRAVGDAVRVILSLPGRLLALPAEMLRLGGEVAAGLAAGIGQGVTAAVEAVRALGARMRDGFKALLGIRSPSQVFMDLGGEVVAGLVLGLQQRLAAAGEAIRSVGASVRDTFKDLLGIRSPSRVFAQMGGNLSEGLALGMGEKLASITKAAAGMAAAASVSLGLPALAGQALPDINQTIRQAVPDLPDVPRRQAAAGAGSPDAGGGMVVHYAPVLTIQASGAAPGAVRQEAEKALAMSLVEFEKMMRRYEAEKGRRAVR